MMEKTQLPLTKTCSVCGQQKPFSAFLQLAGPQGTTYSNICSSCRKTAMEKSGTKKEPEEQTTISTGFKIDAKAKVQDAVEKREHLKKVKELGEEEQKKKEGIKLEKTRKTDFISKSEREHRETFLKGKRSFLDLGRQPEKRERSGEITQRATEEAVVKEQIAREEQQATTTDLTVPYLDTQFGEKLKYGQHFREFQKKYGQHFQEFQRWLGKDKDGKNPAITQTIEQMFKKTDAVTAQPVKTTETTPGKGEKDPLIDYINKNWGPSRRR